MIGRRINLVDVILRDGALSLEIHYAKSLIIYYSRYHVLLVRTILLVDRLKEAQRI